ncbi:unnamed protein product [Euphydryas editha]|uniref:Uncharacterized protein n=1 Tax=Euphydryas editha TaxID=104508 RepID=A0AAU9UFJ2_EUPED|nr:unnamed protein product [Euphydryas editha]
MASGFRLNLWCIPLILEIEYPVLTMEPEVVDFGDVSDGSTRKSYITVTHSSPTTTIHLEISWTGAEQFRFWPPNLTLSPGTSARIYIEYTAVWLSGSSASGTLSARAAGGGAAARWCGARAHATARARRGAARRRDTWTTPTTRI